MKKQKTNDSKKIEERANNNTQKKMAYAIFTDLLNAILNDLNNYQLPPFILFFFSISFYLYHTYEFMRGI